MNDLSRGVARTDGSVNNDGKMAKKGKQWSVLGDGYMMGAKLTDWDKDADSDEDGGGGGDDVGTSDEEAAAPVAGQARKGRHGTKVGGGGAFATKGAGSSKGKGKKGGKAKGKKRR
jgi:hypothetical protein